MCEGDIVSVDFGAIVDGYHGDSAFTVGVGKISGRLSYFCQLREKSLNKGIEQAKVGSRLTDISNAVQTPAEGLGFLL
ncbi:MAG: hypothetical protein CM1200mP3_18990 [Chloroflexota bacterium]|nr:MAG: hypothetical protein CM1200mP3_18990 [Chloroflexota bacterium]